jgi:hypothetical protein
MRKKEAAASQVTSGHAGQAVTTAADVTTQKQTQSEDEEQTEHGAYVERQNLGSARSPEFAALPPAAAALLHSIPDARRAIVESEMRAVLGLGHQFRKSLVRADHARLESKCRDTLDAHAKDPKQNLWAYALSKLADRSDVAAQRVALEQAVVQDDDREFAARRLRVLAWAEDHPLEAEKLRAQLAHEMPGTGSLLEMARESGFVSRAWQLATGA